MSKKTKFKPTVRTREMLPLAKKTKTGVLLLCPFCTPAHPITPGQSSSCGTSLRVTAVQQVISARTARQENLVCVKCKGIGGGEMVQYLNGYIHVNECAPDVQLLREIPKYSKLAALAYKLPESVRSLVEKRTGVVQMVREITPDGEETGNIQGYFFRRKEA